MPIPILQAMRRRDASLRARGRREDPQSPHPHRRPHLSQENAYTQNLSLNSRTVNIDIGKI